ncbi:hypothetical protein PG990_011163 [Apiospora arundinis]
MASFGRSLKPPSYLSTMGRRPGMPGRSMSNTSEASSAPSSPGDLNPDEVFYSPKPSPNANNSSLSRRVGDMHLKVPERHGGFSNHAVLAEAATRAGKAIQSPPEPGPLSDRGEGLNGDGWKDLYFWDLGSGVVARAPKKYKSFFFYGTN